MFSFNEVENFDTHIAQSIPNYDLLFNAVLSISRYFVTPNTNVIDLGCSTGKMLERIPHDGVKVGIDTAHNLLPESHGETYYFDTDIETFNGFDNSSLVTSIFTLQFIPRQKRLDVINRIHDGLIDGGAFIWAEKVYSESAFEQELMTFGHYDFKRKFFKENEILDKEKDLRTLMRPNSSFENSMLASQAGFQEAFMFWKFFNFEAWVYIK